MARTKPTPPALLALGRKPVPPTLDLADGQYSLEKTYKHDFFAVTARYAKDDRCIIVKINRRAPLLCIPMGWIGRILASRETAAYESLSDVPAVPKFIARIGKHGIAHEYVPGHPLRKGERVGDAFFSQLRDALAAIHDRGMAYVDLEKCENVIVGDDGRPYLVDFQIAWNLPSKFGGNLWPLTMIRRRLQMADLYHVVKLQRRTRPDQLSQEELERSYRKPWYVRVHGVITRPFTLLRRRVLNRVDPRRRRGERGRVQ